MMSMNTKYTVYVGPEKIFVERTFSGHVKISRTEKPIGNYRKQVTKMKREIMKEAKERKLI